MKSHPANPASVYRVHSEREAREDYKLHVRGIAQAFIDEMLGRRSLWARALDETGLPRNYFTERKP